MFKFEHGLYILFETCIIKSNYLIVDVIWCMEKSIAWIVFNYYGIVSVSDVLGVLENKKNEICMDVIWLPFYFRDFPIDD